ncbi:MAG: ATP synthase F1 subunit epsilon [Lachnospiraceae bacterium]|nr:ATP synthase F1 subunit epsilon [Lachnospiraceae bacterium]
MSKPFHLKILASDKTFFDGDAVSLNVPAYDGAYQILASHEPVVMAVREGVIRFRYFNEEGKEVLKTGINGLGLVNITRDVVTVLVDTIEAPEDIDRARAEEALQRAMEQLRQDQSIQEYHLSQAAMARAMLRLSESGKAYEGLENKY